MNSVLAKLVFVVCCVVLPVAWGLLVNWLFNVWRQRAAQKTEDEPLFPDYQI